MLTTKDLIKLLSQYPDDTEITYPTHVETGVIIINDEWLELSDLGADDFNHIIPIDE